MKVILAVDAIQPALAGIGRYTWELANRLPSVPGIRSVEYFHHGRWVTNIEALLNPTQATVRIRKNLVHNRFAVAAYRGLAPYVLKYKLKSRSGHIFHGPNFYIPAGTGPAVATIHDLSIYRYPQFHPPERVAYMEREVPLALERAGLLIAVSEFTRQEVMSYFGWPADKIVAIPLGVGGCYHPRSAAEVAPVLIKYQLPYSGYTLFVSTIEPRKNIDRLLTAYEMLPAALRNRFPLVLAGGFGWRSEGLHQRIADASRAGWLRYLGFVPESELPLLFSGARAFAFPSIYEGFGLPVIEAMASGIPVLISNRASLPEVAQGAAWVVEAEDPVAIRNGLEKVLVDDTWRATAITNSLIVASRYTWENTTQQTVALYSKLA